MVTEILIFTICIVSALGTAFLAWLNMRQFEKERKEWREERSKLLDRIQSSGLSEFKAQERAEKPIKRIVKDPVIKGLEKERWL